MKLKVFISVLKDLAGWSVLHVIKWVTCVIITSLGVIGDVRMTRRIAMLAGVVAVCAALYVLFGRDMVTFSNVKLCANAIRTYVYAHYWQSVALFCAAYFASIILLISTAPLALLAGYVFGMSGAAYVFVCGVIGAPCAFLLSRYVLGDWIQRHFKGYLKAFNDEIDEHGVWYLIVVRLIPVIPFVVVNVLAGLTTISLRVFIISTAIGIIVPTLLFVYAGTQLAHLSCVWDIFSWQVVLIFLALLTIALVTLQYKRLQRRALRN